MTPAFRPLAIALCLAPLAGQAESQIERGAYLAKVTGCEGCHSPHDEAGAVPPSKLMAGGDHPIRAGGGPGMVPPDITPAAIGGWDIAAIATAIRTGRTPDGRVLSQAMPWRTQFSGLTEEDARAIAAYLRTIPAHD